MASIPDRNMTPARRTFLEQALKDGGNVARNMSKPGWHANGSVFPVDVGDACVRLKWIEPEKTKSNTDFPATFGAGFHYRVTDTASVLLAGRSPELDSALDVLLKPTIIGSEGVGDPEPQPRRGGGAEPAQRAATATPAREDCAGSSSMTNEDRMPSKIPPLNGTKTHPLTNHALGILDQLNRHGPMPQQEINSGVVNRFHRESLTETVLMKSPYATHKGKDIDFEQITEAGRAALPTSKRT